MRSSTLSEAVLPPEILDLIFSLAFPLKPKDDMLHFHRVRQANEERSLVAVLRKGSSTRWYSFFRSLLWSEPHVGSALRAKRLAEALALALPRQPSTKGYLASLVSHLAVEIRERRDKYNARRPEGGIQPSQVVELARLLPHLGSLSINCLGKGGWLGDATIVQAFHEFKGLRHIEITGTKVGYRNARAVADGFELESLKLKSLSSGWTTFADRSTAVQQLFAMPVSYKYSSTLTTLALWGCTLAEIEYTSLFGALVPSAPTTPTALRRLTLHHLSAPAPPDSPLNPVAFPQGPLVSALLPLVPTLEALHLVLYDRAPIANAETRCRLQLEGKLSPSGHLALPDPGARAGNVVSRLLGPHCTSLTLGGPWCVDEGLYDALDASGAGTIGALRRLELVQCAEVERSGAGVRGVEGLSARGFRRALDREWAGTLECVDVSKMQSRVNDHGVPGYRATIGASIEQDEGESETAPSWGVRQLEKLVERVGVISDERVRQGRRRIVLVYDEGLEERDDDAEAHRRKRAAERGSSSGKGGKKVGVLGVSSKRAKTV
ncbi:hypothetical protein Rhopal_006288-T1 [Rhodotorula paludigena]|uniref:Proteophosphoglycan 5 n=1 Tax=Rhodotorula paludigena TaxID=86838 RepID=A0AAV5GKX9_9BASI|nr:hypothetical protein Rhopal_006288-T1 [Rhodotorula paludigena]